MGLYPTIHDKCSELGDEVRRLIAANKHWHVRVAALKTNNTRLVDALEKLVAWHDWDNQKEDGDEVITVEPFLDQARAAIAKAVVA